MNPELNIVGVIRARDAAQYLPALIPQMKIFCSEVLLLDDQSTDDTAGIAGELGAKVRFNTGLLDHHEGRDRRLLHGWASQFKPDWIYAPDTDDLLEPGGAERIAGMVKGGHSAGMEAFSFPYLYLWGDMEHYRVDGIYERITACRLFRFFPDMLPPDREVHSMAVAPEIIARGKHCTAKIRLLHLGYMTPEQRMEKYMFHSENFPEGSEGWAWSGGRGYEHIIGRGATIRSVNP